MADPKIRIRHLVNQQYLRKETSPCKKEKISPSMLPTAEEMLKTACIPTALRLQMKHLLWRRSLGTSSVLNTGTVTGTHADGYVGGIVGRVFSGTNQISNSLNAGQLSSKKTATTGTVIGHENGTVTLTNVYAVKDATYTKLIGTGAQETGSVSGTKERADIIGYGALHNLGELNADNLWVERSDDVPSLKRFIKIEEE